MKTTGSMLDLLFSYSPETGRFTHKTYRGPRTNGPGSDAGTARPDGYTAIKLPCGSVVLAHRLAWLWMTGEWPKLEIDHQNGNRADNRWVNLREATRSQQAQNGAMRSTNNSGRIGVFFDKHRNKWTACVTLHGRNVFRKRFASFEAACAAREAAERKLFGEFASDGRRVA